MADDFTKEQLAEFREAFNMFDKDGSGNITIEEMVTVMRELELDNSPSEEKLTAELHAMDTNKDGTIDFDEFLATIKKTTETTETREQELRDCFKLFDKDDKGYLTLKELKHILQDLGKNSFTDEEVNELIKEGDVNEDGHLDYDEFVKLLTTP
ncbi:calmodulin-like [Mizuhopecten yessoensis]|uniref:Calmodulin n=1 Tax=Mizuhopecten yessoensis TaxID=6573 RepID=A0A210PKQ8_MIZYE|nr:calmodulin-like [Mizuhopecten yessoensis]OWF37073.1 Calmodulin [Mizuhopecten yessoensis]